MDPILQNDFSIRAVTVFVNLHHSDFVPSLSQFSEIGMQKKINDAVSAGRCIERALVNSGYTVQTLRITTNDFPSYLIPPDVSESEQTMPFQHRLCLLVAALRSHNINFCSVGNSSSRMTATYIPTIINSSSGILYCSANVPSDSSMGHAHAAAFALMTINHTNPTGNSRFYCNTNYGVDEYAYVPFFPASRSDNEGSGVQGFSLGLENGTLVKKLLKLAGSIVKVEEVLSEGMLEALEPVAKICGETAEKCGCKFLGIDPSINFPLSPEESVTSAFEKFSEGLMGTLSGASAATAALRSLPIPTVGYKGILLNEDVERPDNISAENRVTKNLSISATCGVGVNTIPVPFETSEEELATMLLGVAALSHRHTKPLACRVVISPEKIAFNRARTADILVQSGHTFLGCVSEIQELVFQN